MRKFGLIFISVPLFLFTFCEKKPQASFTTDKDEYVAGETVKLTNTSETGSSFEWILSGEQTSTDKNTSFIINPNLGFDELSITLVAKSKLHCKRNSFTKSIRVIPGSHFTVQSLSPASSYTFSFLSVVNYSNANNYVIQAPYEISPETFGNLFIYFPLGTLPPPTGTYTLQNSSTSLASFNAFVTLLPGPVNYTVGQLQVDYINGKLHIVFTNISDSTGNYKLTGEVYKP